MADTILLVDDDAAVLSTHLRLLAPLTLTARGAPPVSIETATSGAEAESYLLTHPACAVVVSDLRMPGMDGLALLERARNVRPDAVRIILTAHADLQSATEAINRTAVFRLLDKPCRGEALRTAVTDALRTHQRVIAERQLLEHALRQRPGSHDRSVADSPRDVETPEMKFESRVEALSNLSVGMILDEDWLSPSGLLIVPRGRRITQRVLERLESLTSQELRKQIKVLTPRS
jgi:DNA-binding NtrC family response regulator